MASNPSDSFAGSSQSQSPLGSDPANPVLDLCVLSLGARWTELRPRRSPSISNSCEPSDSVDSSASAAAGSPVESPQSQSLSWGGGAGPAVLKFGLRRADLRCSHSVSVVTSPVLPSRKGLSRAAGVSWGACRNSPPNRCAGRVRSATGLSSGSWASYSSHSCKSLSSIRGPRLSPGQEPGRPPPIVLAGRAHSGVEPSIVEGEPFLLARAEP